MACRPTILAAVLLAASLSCDQAPSSSATTHPVTNSHSSSDSLTKEFAERAQVGPNIFKETIRGRVLFAGRTPILTPLNNQPCHPNAKPIYDETVVVNPDHGLRNAVVYLPQIGITPPQLTARVMLDQSDCRYTPHVVAVQTGQTLRVTSSDPTLHNVHVLADANPSVNVAMTGVGQFHDLVFKAPEFLRTKCDVHPWMTAYVAVIDNPFFAVTRDDGTFEIKNAPAGNYTVACWHERLGDLKQQITIPTDGTTELTFTYEQP